MSASRRAMQAAFPHTLPILAGFLFLGISYGFLIGSKGFPIWYPILASTFTLAGSMQFISIQLLLGPFQPLHAFFLTLLVNARHLFYGLSLLDKYRGLGAFKPYLIFGLCDETFSVICSTPCPSGVDERRFSFFITLFDHVYWVLGSTLGALLQLLLSRMTNFNTNGIEFVMTALFFLIFLNQWEGRQNRLPALAGVGASLLSLLVFGAEAFLLPAMALILLFFFVQHRVLRRKNV